MQTGHTPPELHFKKTKYPQSKNTVLPDMYPVIAAVAPRGVGKTYSTCQLVRSYEMERPINPDDGTPCSIKTYIISPTYHANEVFKSLESVDEDNRVWLNYTHDTLREIEDMIKEDKTSYEQYKYHLTLWRKFKRAKNADQFNHMELLTLNDNDFEEPEHVPKTINFLILDDCVGAECYKAGKNPLVNLTLRNRHSAVIPILLVQSLRTFPKSIRNNVSVWMIGRQNNKAFMDELYNEVGSATLTEDQFRKVFDDAINEPYGMLCVDYSKPENKRFTCSFKKYLTAL